MLWDGVRVGDRPAGKKGEAWAALPPELRRQLDRRSAIERGAHLLVLSTLKQAEIPFVVGGAYALHTYTGLYRETKDLDVFLLRRDVERALEVLSEVNFRTEMLDPVWIAKAYASNDYFADLIFSSGNGVAEVDERWFTRATSHPIHGLPVLIAPPEEMIWSKSYVCERERYDGADINHIVLTCGRTLDWAHLLGRFDSHWPVLLSHLLLFRFSYPGHQDRIPAWVWEQLLAMAASAENQPELASLCRGTLLSRQQYQTDLEHWGFRDARFEEVESYRDNHDEREGSHRGGG